MSIDRDYRDEQFMLVSYRLIDTLQSWMINEKRNLEGFIENPQGHVDYSPYLIIDFTSLAQRAGLLGQIAAGLGVISYYKKGVDGVTKSMHDNALDHIPNVIWKRLRDWAAKRARDMEQFLVEQASAPPLPIEDYRSAATFNPELYGTEMMMYRDGVGALDIVMQYATEDLTVPANNIVLPDNILMPES
jgi:hypothetical protein